MEIQAKPLINTNLRWFMLAMVLANTGAQMSYSMVSLYMVDMGATVSQIGMVFTIASLVPMALQILGGWFSDTVGRLRAIALGSTISALGYLIFFLAPSWEWILVGLCIEYVSSAVVGPSFSSYIAEQSEEDERGRVFGITSSIFSVVGVIGPALGGFLAYRLSFRWMMLGAFALYFLATLVRVWMARSERFAPERGPQELTWTGLRTELVAMFGLLFAGGLLTWIWVTDAIGDTAFNLIGQLYPIYLADIGGLNLEQIGLLNALRGGANIVSAFVSGWLIDRRSEREIVIVGFILEAAGIIVVLQAKDFAGYLLAMVVFGLGTGSLGPAYNSLISKAVPEEKRGLAYGLFGTSLSLLALPFPWIGAQLWEGLGPQVPFWIVVGACLISVPIAWFTFIVPQSKDAETAASNT